MKKAIAIGVIIFLLLGLGVGSYFLIKGGSSQSVTYGSTFLSIDEVQITDSGQRIIIQGVVNGAENLKIDFNKDVINEKIKDQGYRVNDIATLQVSMENPSREFYASKDERKIFSKIDYFELSIFKRCDNNIPGRLGLSEEEVFRVGTTKLCAYQTFEGVHSDFTGVVVDNTRVEFKIDGNLIGAINPSVGSNVVRSGDGKARVEWTGNLVNYIHLTKPSYALLFKDSEYQRMIDLDAWTSTSILPLFFRDEIGTFTSTDTAKSIISNLNNDLNLIMQDKTSKFTNEVNAESIEFTDKGLKVYMKTANVFPSFKITLDARYVEIEELKGEPKIISCAEDKSIRSGEKYNLQIVVKNIGINTGSFFGSVSCDGDSQVNTIAIPEMSIIKDQTKTFSFQISGINLDSGKQRNNCVVTIEDRKSGDRDTCNFNLEVEFQENIICTPDSVVCIDSKTLKKCNSDGTSYETEDCQYGCAILESGESQCKEKDDPLPSIDCGFFKDHVQKESCQGNPLCWAGISEPKVINKCVLSTWVYLAFTLLVLAIIIFSIMIKRKLKR